MSFTDFVDKKSRDPKRVITEGITDDEWNTIIARLEDVVNRGKIYSVSNATIIEDVSSGKKVPISMKKQSNDEYSLRGFGVFTLKRDDIMKIVEMNEYQLYWRDRNNIMHLINFDATS